jgi:hypothetical protein
MGFPSHLEVASDEDVTGPVLLDFDFTPKSVDVSTGSAEITCTMALTDSPAGVDNPTCWFYSPVGVNERCGAGNPVSGDDYDGVWSCVLSIPQYAAEGSWSAQVRASDHAGNERRYYAAELEVMGVPDALTVGFNQGAPLALVVSPRHGTRIRGNSLTVRARLIQGSPDDVSLTLGVRFDFRSLPSGVFAPIPARNANHPNPDTTYPYFIHWDLSGVADGDYELRAVAHDTAGVPDPAPETITVTVDDAGPVDIDENFTAESIQESHTSVDDAVESYVGSGDWTDASTAAELIVPAGALTSPTDTAILGFPDPAGEEPLLDPSEQSIGAFVDLALQSGQTDFESGLTGDLIVSYSDHDQDGYVDGTGIPESELELRYYDANAGAYVPMPGWTVMTEHNMVHTETPFTGRFAVIPEPSRWMMVSAGMCLLAGLYRLRHRT